MLVFVGVVDADVAAVVAEFACFVLLENRKKQEVTYISMLSTRIISSVRVRVCLCICLGINVCMSVKIHARTICTLTHARTHAYTSSLCLFD